MQRVDDKMGAPVRGKRGSKSRKPQGQVYDMHNEAAKRSGPDKQEWTKHDVVHFSPANPRQADCIRAYCEGNDLAMLGAPGAGKTLLAVYLASSSLVNHEEGIERIIVVRSAVQGRDQGHLPGDLTEKMEPYEAPYEDAFGVVFGHPTSFTHLKNRKKVVFTSTSMKRGVNFRNAVVILDEVQNYNFGELNTMVTRLNESCRLIITGDLAQCDLNTRKEVSGMLQFYKMLPHLPTMYMTEFTWDECQRGQRVKDWLRAVDTVAQEEKSDE